MPPQGNSAPEAIQGIVNLDNVLSDQHERPEHRTNRAAFGRFLKPEMYDIFGEYDLKFVSDAEKRWMTSSRLKGFLFDRSNEDACVVDHLALNGYEYKIIARSPKKLAEAAFSTTLAIDDVNSNRLTKAHRSSDHTLESKQDVMIAHLTKLQEYRVETKELEKFSWIPGKAHKPEEHMRLLFNHAWTEFKTILEVVHIQREWDDNQRHRAEAALIFYMTQGSQRDRTKHWREMISLANAYLSRRISLFEGRIGVVQSMLPQRENESSEAQ